MQGDTLKDAALEREIEHALAVDPSPELLARVRSRIASKPIPSTPWVGHRMFLVASVAALAFVVGVSVRLVMLDGELPASRAPVLSSESLVLPSPIDAYPLDASRISRIGDSGRRALQVVTHTRLRSSHPAVPTSTPIEPKVLVDKRESETIRRLIASLAVSTISGDQSNPFHPADSSQSAPESRGIPDIEPMPILSIPPIDIQPLAPVAHEEGARK